jgi:uncharacterized protein YbjT (DUF2867 family)
MRIAVVGGTGLAGRHTVAAVQRAGHEALVLARSRGVDVATGAGLDEALAGADAVVDVGNYQAAGIEASRYAFALATKTLLAASMRAQVGHYVLLSIVGIERIAGNAHYTGKRVQERLLAESGVPYSLLRATQFHDFAATVVSWTRQAGEASVPPVLVQPIAVAEVAEALARIATGSPQGRVQDLAGPAPEDLVDMARRTLAVRGEALRLIPSWRTGVYGVEAAGEVLLPGPEARLAETSFDAWLEQQRVAARG